MLTEKDHHFWGPSKEVWEMLLRIIPKEAKVLDVGPGWHPFPRADMSVDFQSPKAFPGVKWPKEWVQCDLANEPLPFKDKSFDFIYCRQVLEDMWNPFRLMEEMSRVGKAGYIECPSPIAELCRGADAGTAKYRGFAHHHWIVYAEDGILKFIAKYPLVEHVMVNDGPLGDSLRRGHKYWSTYFQWKDRVAFKHLQNAVDFHLPDEYPSTLTDAIIKSFKSIDQFWSKLEKANV